MALKARGTPFYWYRSVRRGGGVYSESLGAGPAAVLEEHLARRERAGRRADREAGRRAAEGLARVVRQADRLSARVDGAFGDAMTYLGYYRHHRQWRRRGK